VKYRGISTQAGGSAARLPRLRLLAKGAFEQRFLANSPSWPGSARPRPRGAPSGCTSCAGRGGRGPFTPLRCHGSREGSQAVTNPRGGLVCPRPSAAARGFALGLVTARSSCALFLPIFAHFLGTLWCTFLRVLPLFFGAFCEPWQRSRPIQFGSAGALPHFVLSGARTWAFRSPVAPAGAGGSRLVHVDLGDRREPHRRPGSWGGPPRLPRFGKRGCAATRL